MSLPAIDPAGLFDVRGKSALVVGATGSFGKVVCATLGRAGARLTITAGNGEELEALRRSVGSGDCRDCRSASAR
jgi:NAD(P)-dependent dehydrogenase (short-subunit alcohol dehydrogenase family)